MEHFASIGAAGWRGRRPSLAHRDDAVCGSTRSRCEVYGELSRIASETRCRLGPSSQKEKNARGACEQFSFPETLRHRLSARPSMRLKLFHLPLSVELSGRGVFHHTKWSVPMSSRADSKLTCLIPSRRELTRLAKNTPGGRNDEPQGQDTKRRCKRGTHLAQA